MSLDHHNGKSVESVEGSTVTLNDGTAIEVSGEISNDITGSVLLQVVEGNNGVYLHFGYPRKDQQGQPLPPQVVAIVEATVSRSEGTDA